MTTKNNYILGIESSCDDTSAAVLCNTKVLSNVVATQEVHKKYGGVVPELASRAHQQNIVPVVHQALAKANIDKKQLSAIAFTRGPGLMGSLLVGTSFAKSLALALNLPLIEVNHMEAHILAHFIKDEELSIPPFPFLFPKPKVKGLNFSFSGLKTSILYFLQRETRSNPNFAQENLEDICASIQYTILEILMEKLKDAAEQTGIKHIAIGGGVAANSGIRARLENARENLGWTTYIPKFQYCTDNAAMIGIVGYLKFLENRFTDQTVAAKRDTPLVCNFFTYIEYRCNFFTVRIFTRIPIPFHFPQRKADTY